jgi:hypothetical protein
MWEYHVNQGAGPTANPTQHPTSNIERPTSNDCAKRGLWMFDVGCWVLDVPSPRFRGSKRELCLSGNPLPVRPSKAAWKPACRRSADILSALARWLTPKPTPKHTGGQECPRSGPSAVTASAGCLKLRLPGRGQLVPGTVGLKLRGQAVPAPSSKASEVELEAALSAGGFSFFFTAWSCY